MHLRARDIPERYNACEILERNLPGRADEVAVLHEDRCVTFAELSEEANRVGNGLKSLGVGFGDTVAILAPDSVEWAATFFGTVKIGAVALGLNTLLTPREYAFMLRDARARAVVVHRSLRPALDDALSDASFLEHVITVDDETARLPYTKWIGGQSAELAAEDTHRDDICSVNYSSGTTGEPKGIPHAHKDYPLTASLWGEGVLGLRASDRTFATAKLFFTYGLGGNLIFPLSVGASAVLFSGPPRVATNVLEVIERFKPTILYNAPTSYAASLAVEGFAERFDLSSLRVCVSAGEALPAPLWRAWKDATGLDIVDGIGSTENFHIFLSNRQGDIRPGSSGKPFDGYDVAIVDEDGDPVPDGQVGNLWVRGETAALSYLHRSELSRRTFRGEWLVTGDKYRRDEDGYYWHAGRSDDMLKVGGIWVSPVEVESTLIAHPDILECAVVGKQDDAGLTKPLAYVSLREGAEPSDDLARSLVSHCTSKMAAYKRPRWVEFVQELPKTATGKIQRFRLRGNAE